MQKLCMKTYAPAKLLRKIKQDLNKWRDTSCSWISKFNIVGISVLPILIYGFNEIIIKILMGVFLNLTK